MSKSVFLVGFMGSGKTTVGKKLASQLNYTFVDLDALIEQQEGISISKIFELHGETHFRKLENQYLESLIGYKQQVIACGGGTPCFFNAMSLMNEKGITVYLQMNALAIFNRLKQGRMQRPLITGKSDEELQSYITEKLQEREPIYMQAHMIVPAIGLNIGNMINKIGEFTK